MQSKLIYRYSSALYEASVESKSVKKIAADCAGLIDLIKQSSELQLLFRSPVIDRLKKEKILTALFKGRINGLTLNLLILLVKNGREINTSDVLEGYLNMLDEEEGIIKPVFTSAVELTDKEKTKIKKDLDEMSGKEAQPVYEVDPGIIGGFTIRMKDSIIDGSVKRQLELMKQSLRTKSI
ncbi:MAG: ATP synthase F1 subunit delta [Bacteroidetes bacterium]|nr:ATP synthase F1 subunit delta [Bacteroidota bacterium]